MKSVQKRTVSFYVFIITIFLLCLTWTALAVTAYFLGRSGRFESGRPIFDHRNDENFSKEVPATSTCSNTPSAAETTTMIVITNRRLSIRLNYALSDATKPELTFVANETIEFTCEDQFVDKIEFIPYFLDPTDVKKHAIELLDVTMGEAVVVVGIAEYSYDDRGGRIVRLRLSTTLCPGHAYSLRGSYSGGLRRADIAGFSTNTNGSIHWLSVGHPLGPQADRDDTGNDFEKCCGEIEVIVPSNLHILTGRLENCTVFSDDNWTFIAFKPIHSTYLIAIMVSTENPDSPISLSSPTTTMKTTTFEPKTTTRSAETTITATTPTVTTDFTLSERTGFTVTSSSPSPYEKCEKNERWSNERCVPPPECQDSQCPRNNVRRKHRCRDDHCTAGGCVCKDGYYRHHESAKCVRWWSCYFESSSKVDESKSSSEGSKSTE